LATRRRSEESISFAQQKKRDRLFWVQLSNDYCGSGGRMNILVIGGTRFVGRWFVESALARGHKLTLFNRGSKSGLFPGVEEVHGDREQDLNALADGRWDAVLDTCGYAPNVVQRSAQFLQGRAGQYTFVSSLSAYANFGISNQDEHAALAVMPEGERTDVYNPEYYGPLKVLCEQAADAAFPGRALIVRPGYIIGPCDPTGRFTYWPRRISEGGEVLAPGSPSQALQVVDARDLGDWMVRAIENQLTGAYNATSPNGALTLGDALEACCQASKSGAKLTWVPEDFLRAHQVKPWQDLPFWQPDYDQEDAGQFHFEVSKAVEAGLNFRPITETVTDLLAWDRTPDGQLARQSGMSREREEEILSLYHEKKV
jgi:2'-hydroxyisoflavone reductase